MSRIFYESPSIQYKVGQEKKHIREKSVLKEYQVIGGPPLIMIKFKLLLFHQCKCTNLYNVFFTAPNAESAASLAMCTGKFFSKAAFLHTVFSIIRRSYRIHLNATPGFYF